MSAKVTILAVKCAITLQAHTDASARLDTNSSTTMSLVRVSSFHLHELSTLDSSTSRVVGLICVAYRINLRVRTWVFHLASIGVIEMGLTSRVF